MTPQKLIFYDQIYQKIEVSDPLIQKLIFTKDFQRLKNINQLGTFTILRNSVRHTRFSHCLGVYHLLNLLFQKEVFCDLSEKEKREIKIAGLLHDIGHGPFSHTFEKLLPNFTHEHFSIRLIKDPQGEIFALLKKHDLDIERICNLILNRNASDWGQKIISGQFDFDRLDYLIRDRHFTGWQFHPGNFNWVIDNLELVDSKLFFKEKAILYVENYLIFRFYVYQQLFWNPTNLLLKGVLVSVFDRLRDLWREQKTSSLGKFQFILEEKLPDLENFRALDDNDFFVFLKKLQKTNSDEVLQILLKILCNPPTTYEHLYSDDVKVLQHLPSWQHKYFTFSSNQKIVIYRTVQDEEIKFITAAGKIKTLSEISLFFNESKIFQQQLKIYLKI